VAVSAAPGFAKHPIHFRELVDDAVGRLKQLLGAWPIEMPGSVVGMYMRAPSSSGGMASEPRLKKTVR